MLKISSWNESFYFAGKIPLCIYFRNYVMKCKNNIDIGNIL